MASWCAIMLFQISGLTPNKEHKTEHKSASMSALVEVVVVSQSDLHPPSPKKNSLFQILNILMNLCLRTFLFLIFPLKVKLFSETRSNIFSSFLCSGGILQIYKASDNTGGI